jgi:hypothetical protein
MEVALLLLLLQPPERVQQTQWTLQIQRSKWVLLAAVVAGALEPSRQAFRAEVAVKMADLVLLLRFWLWTALESGAWPARQIRVCWRVALVAWQRLAAVVVVA